MTMSILISVLLSFAAPPYAQESVSLSVYHQITQEMEEKIQHDFLDPLLGEGQSSVFVKLDLKFKLTNKNNMKEGLGHSGKTKYKIDETKAKINLETNEETLPDAKSESKGEGDLFEGFGFGTSAGESDKKILKDAVRNISVKEPTLAGCAAPFQSHAVQTQGATLGKTENEDILEISDSSSLKIAILHNERLSPESLTAVKRVLPTLYEGMTSANIQLYPVPWHTRTRRSQGIRFK